MANKLIIDGATVLGSTDSASSIICKDNEGNNSNIQTELDKINDKVEENLTEIHNKIPFELAIDANGNYGYKKVGADTVTPFNNINNATLLYEYTGRSGSGVNADYKACGYSLTESDYKQYSYFIYSMVTIGCNCISYSGISTMSMPSGAIKLYDQSGQIAGGSVSGSNGQMDYRNILYLIPRQSKAVKISASGRGGLIVKLWGLK